SNSGSGQQLLAARATCPLRRRFALPRLPNCYPDPELVLRAAWRARERDRVAHVRKASDVGDGALEAQAEARVRHAAVAAQVAVPAHRLLVDADLVHAGVEHLEALFALAAADDLADAGREHVHRGDGPAVVVDAHIERLDVLRVVHHDHGLLGVLLGEIALVLGLQVDAPLRRKLELLLPALAHRNRPGG